MTPRSIPSLPSVHSLPGTVRIEIGYGEIDRGYGEIHHVVFDTVLVPNGRSEFTAGEVSHRVKNCGAVGMAG